MGVAGLLVMLGVLVWLKSRAEVGVGGGGLADNGRSTAATTAPPGGWFVGQGGIGNCPAAPPTAEARAELPRPCSSQLPPVSAYGEIETIRQDDRLDPASGVTERVRLVRADFKYPLLRVEESFVIDESDGKPRQVLLKRAVMVADHVLVSKPDEELLKDNEFRLLAEVSPGSDAWRVSIPAESPEDLPEALARLEEFVEIAEPDYLVFHQETVPDDPRFSDLWGMRNSGQTGGTAGADVKATQAWQHATGGGQVVVAIIDTGVDYLHPDLVDNIYQNTAETVNGTDSDGNGYIDDARGWDFYGNDNDPMDDHFHGTHVAGTVGARGNNNVGVAGVIWNVRLLPLKFLSAQGGGAVSDAIAAVRYSADNGARISCNSWGGGGYSRLLEDAIRHAGGMNSLFVAAAGNSGSNNDASPSYPASYDLPNIISVAASDHNDEIAWFSNYGANKVHIAAPGVGITSTFPRDVTGAMAEYGLPANYARISGTSMATPHVAGAAALLLDNDPNQSTAQLRNRILQRADFLPGLAGLVSTSARLNVASLVDPSWVPGPAAPDFDRLAWREVSGQSDGDGVAEPGERIEILADISNRGGMDATELVVHSEAVSGPASMVSAANVQAGNLPALDTIRNLPAAVVDIAPSAQDLESVVLRFTVQWQGGAGVSREISIPVVKLTPLQASREVNFSIGEMIRGPSDNKVFLLSPSDWRVMEFDTEAGSFSRYADLDQAGLTLDNPIIKCGGLATNAEGSLLFVALTRTRRIQVFALPEMLPLRTLEVDHEPYSLAVDAQGRLFTTSMDYWGPLREVDANSGRTVDAKNLSNLGRKVYQAALLEMNSARTRLFLGETGLRVTGGPGYVHEWDVTGGAMGLIAQHPNATAFLNDFVVDEPNGQLLTIHGGISGVQVTTMATGAYGNLWPLRSLSGVAVDMPPGREYVFAGSGSPHDGVIRRFQKSTGQDLGAFTVQPAGSSAGAFLKPRNVATTSNNRILYVSTRPTGSHTVGIDSTLYFLNLTGASSISVSLPPRVPLPPRPMLSKIDFSDFGGNGDMLPNPGETVHLAPHIRNVGEAPTTAGTLQVESLDSRVTVTGGGTWAVSAIPGQTTISLPQVEILIGPAVPDGTDVDFLFRLTLGGGSLHEFLHRFTVRLPQVLAGTSPFKFSDLQFSGMAANPQSNEVYMIDSRNLRVVVLDTTYGMISRVVEIPVENPIFNGTLVKLGEPAVAPDGSLLAIAGNQTNRVFVFSLPDLRFVASHATTFRPTHVTFDSLNRIHVTGTNPATGTTLRTLRMDALSGGEVIDYGDNVLGSPLRASKDGGLVGRREGTALKIYDGSALGSPALVHNIPLPGNELYDFEIDPVAGKAYLILGDGKVSVRNLSDGQQTASWDLNNPNWGSAVRICPNGDLVAASDYWYGGGVRRYSPAGNTLHDVVLTNFSDYSGGNPGSVLPRGLAVTPNGRVVFLAQRPADWRSTSVDGYDYTVGILGVPVVLSEPGPDPLKIEVMELRDPSPANNNGFAEPGERVLLVPTLRNTSFNLLRNLSFSLVSSNPKVVPVAPLSATTPALNAGISVQVPVGLAAQIGSTVEDGEPLGLSLQVTHDSGNLLIPLDLFAMKTVRVDVETGFSVGTLLADKTRNVVYVTDTNNDRVLAIDTGAGAVIAATKLAGKVRSDNYSGLAGNGGMALSADGRLLVVALFDSSRLQILSTETLASLDVLRLDFKPLQVAFGSNGRIYATDGVTTGRLREIDPATGKFTNVGTKDHALLSQLLTSADHHRLYVCEVDNFGNRPIHEYTVEEGTSAGLVRTFTYKVTGAAGEIVLDEQERRVLVAMGGTYGIQQSNLERGVTESVWPFASNAHGNSCAYLPGSNFIYGGNSNENSHIRRFERVSGRPIADFPFAVPGVTSMYFYLIERGIVVTPNQRVLFATRNQMTSSIATRHFLGLIGGSSLNMTVPQARPKVDAGPDRTVKLSKPLTLQPVLELPSGSGTPSATWSKLSGSGAVVLSTSVGTTVANFSQPGRYQLQFAAAVDGITSTDTVWVDVEPDDPWINLSAISDKAMHHPGLPSGFMLSREGNPSIPLTVQIQRGGTAVAGTDYAALPSSVVMGAGVSTVEIPLVLLPGETAGTVDLTVSPGAGYEPGAASRASITIVPKTFTDWLSAAQDAHPDLDLSANGDANRNGLDNLMEYLLGRNPSAPSTAVPLEVVTGGTPRSVVARFRALKDPIGAALAIEFSTNLANWNTDWNGTPAFTIVDREDHGDGTETVTAALSPTAAAQPSGYIRLKARVTGH